MVEEIYKMAESLGSLMSDTKYYKDYTYYKNKLDENVELKLKVVNFKKCQFEIESQKAQGIFVEQEAEDALANTYCEIVFNEIGAGFLKNEREVIKMLSQVFESIASRAKVDLDYFD